MAPRSKGLATATVRVSASLARAQMVCRRANGAGRAPVTTSGLSSSGLITRKGSPASSATACPMSSSGRIPSATRAASCCGGGSRPTAAARPASAAGMRPWRRSSASRPGIGFGTARGAPGAGVCGASPGSRWTGPPAARGDTAAGFGVRGSSGCNMQNLSKSLDADRPETFPFRSAMWKSRSEARLPAASGRAGLRCRIAPLSDRRVAQGESATLTR